MVGSKKQRHRRNLLRAAQLFKDGGSIFMTGSIASVKGWPDYSVYAREQGCAARLRPRVAQRTEGQEDQGERG